MDAEDAVREAYQVYYRRLVAQVFGLVGDPRPRRRTRCRRRSPGTADRDLEFSDMYRYVSDGG